ncbi:hypothetical protein [Pontibacter vulgaris]|uniref:hypothetical protein n=1 Tax=Pontibacter vulgaris TaxID=2905679 RepID=UPI001FA749B9|nr:hypothetical protein [Pontibacter vulgaris]
MKKTLNIFKTGVAVAIAGTMGFACSQDRPASNPTDDTSTSEAIVEESPSAANLNNPRPAPIGDTSVNASQADQFGEMAPNQDSAARALHEQDIQKQKQDNPNQRPKITTPPNRRIDGNQ